MEEGGVTEVRRVRMEEVGEKEVRRDGAEERGNSRQQGHAQFKQYTCSILYTYLSGGINARNF